MTHYEIDDVKWRVAETLGDSFSLYSASEIAELEAAFRTDDPEELERIYAKWAERPPRDDSPPTSLFDDPPMPDCLECRRPMRFGYPPSARSIPTSTIRPD